MKDPEPQLLDAVLAYRAAGEPSVAAPLLAAPAADGVDEAALSFLLQRALEDKRKEEQLAKEKEEERKQKVLESLEQMLQQMPQQILGHKSSSSAVQRMKRKKRRKRRTPWTSSRSSCGRALLSTAAVAHSLCWFSW